MSPSRTGRGGIEAVPLIGPFERDPAKWRSQLWHRLDSGEPVARADDYYVFDQDGLPAPGIVPVTMGLFLRKYALHPEADWLGLDGMICTEQTRGVLHRRPVQELSREVVGKEGDVLNRKRDDAQSAFSTAVVESLISQGDP